MTDRKLHNQFCTDDWAMYGGAGPRGMGPQGDGCVCLLAPPDYGLDAKESGETVEDHSRDIPGPRDEKPFEPRLWDRTPDSVVHMAGSQICLFGRYLRQRCDWCGIVLVEYDLARIMVPVGQEGIPSGWPPGALVRVDGHMSALVEKVEDEPGTFKLPMDSCGFDPKTQVGA